MEKQKNPQSQRTGKSSGKIRVAVLYGGRSGEHEISLQSAASVIRNLDPAKFEVIPVGIDREGRWHLNSLSLIHKNQTSGKSLPIFKDSPEVVLPAHLQTQSELVPLAGEKQAGFAGAAIDVVFPVMHGTYCEDGSIQGLLELANVPYVGAGVLGSAIGMDKEVAKRLAQQQGLPVVPYVSLRRAAWDQDSKQCLDKVKKTLSLPVFVKPVNAGSSLGVHKVKTWDELSVAISDAFRFDIKVLVEKGIRAREIEISALEDSSAPSGVRVSVPGEIIPTHEFYSYEAKYLDEDGARLMIPAELSESQARDAQNLAREIFNALECEGMARVDLFLDQDTGGFYLNEINTIPGFTTISMYPKLFEATGLSYSDLLTRLIEVAMDRHARKAGLLRERK